MAVYLVSATAPSGNMRSRPIVAENADEALADWRQEIEIEERGETKGFVFEVQARPDPDGSYERLLLDGERRRLEAAFYAMPQMKQRRAR